MIDEDFIKTTIVVVIGIPLVVFLTMAAIKLGSVVFNIPL